jgi:arylsulfatase A-like enzyme
MPKIRSLILAIVSIAIIQSSCSAQPRRPPNFIVIFTDDLGYGDIQPYGGSIPTPNLNRMAQQGLIATDYYAAANLCTPSRAGLLTGRYAIRSGIAYQVIMSGDERGLPTSERTIPDVLKPTYTSGLFGKWHLGQTGPDWLPTHHGFDHYYGIPYSHDMLPLAIYEADAKTGSVITTPADYTTLQENFYGHAEQFIEQNRDRPFFVDLALSAPHLPEYPYGQFKRASKNAGPFGDVVMQIDSIVGRLFEKLRELHLDQNTIVIFTSDNGPWYEGSSGPLRDRKGGSGYDGGYRVPFITWAPGLIPHGKTNAIISGIDILPTLCHFASLPLPAGLELDGLDISAVLTNHAPSPHDQLVLFNNEEVVAIRTQQRKYVDQAYQRGNIFTFGNLKYKQLYDAVNDIHESYSLADNNPEVTTDMQHRLAEARKKYAPFKKGVPPYFQRQRQQAERQQD